MVQSLDDRTLQLSRVRHAELGDAAFSGRAVAAVRRAEEAGAPVADERLLDGPHLELLPRCEPRQPHDVAKVDLPAPVSEQLSGSNGILIGKLRQIKAN